MKGSRIVIVGACFAFAFAQAVAASGGTQHLATARLPGGTHFRPLAPEHRREARNARIAAGPTPSVVECTATGNPSKDVKLDCDTDLPNNEPHIAVDPLDPDHMVASSNDYDQCCDAFYTTFNGGKTWKVGNMSVEPPGGDARTGSDPVTSFDRKHQVVIHASLNFLNDGCDGDVVVSISGRGIHWPRVVEVADGGGPTSCEDDGLFNDKEWITTDNRPGSPFYGRTYVTWTAFLTDPYAGTLESPIWEAHSDDGGRTWSHPHEISGSNASLCTFQGAGPANQCDEDQFSVPTVGRGGKVYVAFINDQNMALWEPGEVFDDQYLVVRSTDGGVTWSKPAMITELEDGSRDMPINVDGRQTLSGYQLRSPFTGAIVADPTHAGRLYFAFFDNRNGVHDVADPVTDTDVFLTRSNDNGAHWNAPVQVNGDAGGDRNDQWWPWVDVDPTDGTVGVVFLDRSYDPTHGRYGATLAESTDHGASFTSERLNSKPSQPRRSVFFQAHVAGCWACTTFDGDYIGLVYGRNGDANAVWTDMREQDPASGLFLQFIRFARR
jgi:hypothetical protein